MKIFVVNNDALSCGKLLNYAIVQNRDANLLYASLFSDEIII